MSELRSALVSNGVLTRSASDDAYVFTQDYLFPSPTTAAGVVLGRATNGRTDWRSKDGRTLKQLQESEVAG